MALQLLRAFFPRSLVTLFVEPLEQDGEGDRDLAQYRQSSGYREATIFIAPELVEESGPSILQVLRHELVHAHLHQLDVFVQSLIATCPGNRSRKAVTEVYHMLRESAADDISYSVGDLLDAAREAPKEQPIMNGVLAVPPKGVAR